MAALRRVEWSARAERDLDRLHAFLLEHWTQREAAHLLDMVQEFEVLIARWPNGFKRSQRNKHHRLGFVHRNTSAVYRVYRDRVVIVAMFDNRADAAW
ncbi:MAG: type II toxin-antitoxin system RelE/ParE family toxin [Flavobacteriales bacterium]|jgi:plasmid stabilization system protein ParE|nr:type II toxin-antitoxin system RelE/ParE family toxin [Flavobacteriales bacterium]MBK9512711.1 type II toxin-antitoxin system RelE/ParE family toxin [Flavobacteriales bacterium]HOZ41378.1 type II toxin-antitoxin system RelE/ParE family toxin [Flavobacteriales bacterium]